MSQYLSFKGTASRSEYWGVNAIICVALFVAYFIGSAIMSSEETTGIILGGLIMLVATVFYLWYFLAVTVKRCRDAAINAWWTAATFIPYAGIVAWVVFGCLPTDKKD